MKPKRKKRFIGGKRGARQGEDIKGKIGNKTSRAIKQQTRKKSAVNDNKKKQSTHSAYNSQLPTLFSFSPFSLAASRETKVLVAGCNRLEQLRTHRVIALVFGQVEL